MSNTTLCLDIGSGTQDVLLYSPDMEIENCPKFVLPSPAIQIGRRIEAARLRGENIWLHGRNMGGGVTRFIRAHQKAGLTVTSSRSAAYTMADDLNRVTESGIELTDNCPDGFTPIRLTDSTKNGGATSLPQQNSPGRTESRPAHRITDSTPASQIAWADSNSGSPF